MARATFVTLSNEIHHVLVGWREGQVLGQYRLDVLRGNDLAITFVEEAEALFSLFVLARLRTDSLVPVIGHDMTNELEVDVVTLKDLGITLLELLLYVTRAHLVEAEVLKNVTEEVVRDGPFALLKVVIEAFLEVGSHLTGQVASGLTLRRLGDVLLLLSLGCGFL